MAGGTRVRLWAFGAKLKPSESKRQVSSKTKQREQLYTIHSTQFSAVSRIEFAFSHNSDPQKSSDRSTRVQKSELQILDFCLCRLMKPRLLLFLEKNLELPGNTCHFSFYLSMYVGK